MRKKTDEELRRLMELRRSNAATPLRNKKQYSRKVKHKNLTKNENLSGRLYSGKGHTPQSRCDKFSGSSFGRKNVCVVLTHFKNLSKFFCGRVEKNFKAKNEDEPIILF